MLRELIDNLSECYDKNDLNQYIEYDTELHQYIIKMSGNSLVMDIYKRIYSQTQQFRIYSLTTQKRFDNSIIEHKTMVENIFAGKWEEADEINRRHLALAREEIIDHIEATRKAESTEK